MILGALHLGSTASLPHPVALAHFHVVERGRWAVDVFSLRADRRGLLRMRRKARHLVPDFHLDLPYGDYIRLSPSGKRLAILGTGSSLEIVVADLERWSRTVRLAGSPDARMVWGPGDRLVVAAPSATRATILVPGSPRRTIPVPLGSQARWSRDGSRLVVATGSTYRLVSLAGVATPIDPRGADLTVLGRPLTAHERGELWYDRDLPILDQRLKAILLRDRSGTQDFEVRSLTDSLGDAKGLRPIARAKQGAFGVADARILAPGVVAYTSLGRIFPDDPQYVDEGLLIATIDVRTRRRRWWLLQNYNADSVRVIWSADSPR